MKGSRVVALWFGWLLLLQTTSCRNELPPPPLPTPIPTIDILTIGISDSATELVRLVEGEYLSVAPHVRLNFVPGNDQILQADLETGFLDALLVYHVAEGDTSWFNPVAVDGLVLIVHPDNPVTDLTLAEVKAIFDGRLTNWAMLDGPDLPIEPIVREEGSGAARLYLDRVMTGQGSFFDAQVAPGDALMRELVDTRSGSIGYTMMGNTNKATSISIGGIAATPSTTSEQSYPLTTPIYFVSLGEPEGPSRAFLAWLQSFEGQTIIGDSYGRVR